MDTMRNSFCRTCMYPVDGNAERTIECFDIFKTKNFAHKLIQCINLQIEPHDEYPSIICENCFANVLSFYEFQIMCRNSLDNFKIILENKSGEECENVMEESVDKDIVTERKVFLENQMEVKCEKYDLLELADPLLVTTNLLVEQEPEVEEATPGWNFNELKSKLSEEKEDDTNSEIKDEKNERKIAKIKLTEQAPEGKHNPKEENNDSEGMLANPSDDEGTLSGSDSTSSNLKPNTSSGLGLEANTARRVGPRRYVCSRDNCERTFCRLSYLKDHLNQHDGIPRMIYKCDWKNCGKSYSYKCGLQAHKKKYHSGKPIKPEIHMCETCGAVLKSYKSLKTHHLIHTDKAYACDVEGCSKKFRILDALKIHKKRHDGIKNYPCPYCDMRFVTRPNMTNHINHHTWEETIHGKNTFDIKQADRFECSYCDSAFFTVEGKRYHEMIHTGKKPYVCDECGKKFRQSAGLRNHKKTHIDAPKIYVCSTCGSAFSKSETLRHHEMKHTGEKPYKCEECSLSFRWPANFKNHMRQHHTERKVKANVPKHTLQCDHCPKVYNNSSSLKVHIQNNHSGSKREIKCSFCSASFRTIEGKNSHERRHTSEKPHKCEECGKRFIWAYLLRTHQKIHEKKTNREEAIENTL